MNSKELLNKLCQFANKQCQRHNVDVDFENELVLHFDHSNKYIVGIRQATTFKSNAEVFYDSNVHIPIQNASWHRQAYDRHLYNIYIFNDEFQLPNKAYDIILQHMIKKGCKINIESKNFDEIEKKKYELSKEVEAKAKQLFISRQNNPSYIFNCKKLMDSFESKINKLIYKQQPEIALVPEGMHNIEELHIWIDLQL